MLLGRRVSLPSVLKVGVIVWIFVTHIFIISLLLIICSLFFALRWHHWFSLISVLFSLLFLTLKTLGFLQILIADCTLNCSLSVLPHCNSRGLNMLLTENVGFPASLSSNVIFHLIPRLDQFFVNRTSNVETWLAILVITLDAKATFALRVRAPFRLLSWTVLAAELFAFWFYVAIDLRLPVINKPDLRHPVNTGYVYPADICLNDNTCKISTEDTRNLTRICNSV